MIKLESVNNEVYVNNKDYEGNEYFEIEIFKKLKPKKEIYTIQDFTQSQAHGLFWDNEIREKVFGLPKCKNDTKKYDICCEENKYNNTENISIKTSSNNNIDCGDILRFYNGDFDNNYTIILIRYVQLNNQKKINEIIEINYNLELRNYLFGSITEDILTNYINLIKAIPNGPVDTEVKQNYKKQKIQLQNQYNMKINISPKVDSKTQRRVQCSIPKVNDILIKFPQNIISRTNKPIIKGIEITSCIYSEPRKRTKNGEVLIT
jgi:hypothetical protein